MTPTRSVTPARRANSTQGREGASPPEWPSLFAEAAREEAIQRADDHANAEWKHDAYQAIRLLAAMFPDFTADDVWELLEARYDSTTHEPSALGPVFRQAARDGVIVKCGLRPTKLARRHRDITVWRAA